MIIKLLKNTISTALKPWALENNFELPAFAVQVSPKNVPGDYACNVAMLAAKALKQNPREIASKLAGIITSALEDKASKVEVAGAGFINITLSPGYLCERLRKVLLEKDFYGKDEEGYGEKVLIEFVSANPTGPLHIGHGRGAAIGDSLARILSHIGYNVTREYYLNNVGNQMEMLAKSLEARYDELNGKTIEFPADGYHGDYMIEIARKYKDTPKDKLDFKATAIKEIMASITDDLKNFGVSFDTWFSEEEIAVKKDPITGHTAVEDTCEYLKRKGMAFEQDGALWFASTKYGDDKDRVLKRSDGRYTYLASDIAYHKQKLQRDYQKLINLWGADHHGYVARLNAAIQSLGAPKSVLNLILYQLVSLVRNGKPVPMSTRSGEFVTLKEVLDEVGKDACRFWFLLRAPDSQLEFDLELAKKQSSENPVFYVQYVHARCFSIFREAESQKLWTMNPNYNEVQPIDGCHLLTAVEERNLITKLLEFPDVLDLCAKTLTPHHLSAYLMETADTYHCFYEKCRVLTPDKALTQARLGLLEATATVVRIGLRLLGVSAPEKM